ncbi:hypothetical protein DFP72DRAFT_1014486 [Ephemerocybe angulata]|uniref:Uncharacterized protein n=1 Tax=Ephemerocybe angulata TaxID=980116 RepID=A0A8H6LZ11_9AGAR|nr:hypothetical protein DFP72DRAFT_1014486 [Tulosesus angulatus]
MDAQFSPETPCTLNLDILELILYEHRNDHATLAASALASPSLLQIARKFLYRSVSLDYCENPYGHDQQRRLRASLSTNTHLCTYIRTLRLSLPGKKSRDRVLDAILRGLKRVDSLHVIGAGMDAADAVTDERYLVPLLDRDHHHYSSTAILNATPSNAVAREEVELAGNGSVEEALKKVFALKSLRKVTLENIYPLDEIFVGCFTELKHLELISVGGGSTKGGLSSIDTSGWEERRGERVQRRKVQLEYLVLNLEHLKPVLDVIYGHADKEWDERCAVEDGECSSTLDLSGLKQAHVYVWDSDNGHGIWSILHTARRSLERLTLRYFQYTEEHLAYHLGFDNLQSLVLGTHTFSICEDPFRPLILFLNDPAKFSCLRKVKISFDLWGCESSGSSWKEVSGYRGWVELDECFAALDVGCSKGSTIITTPIAQLESIVFELWCSAGYKAISSCPSRLVKSSREASLLTMIREELPYLKRNRNFMLL